MIVRLQPQLLEQLTQLDETHTAAQAEQLDGDLALAVRRTAFMRRLFYIAVLAVALYGTATGAVTAFDLPWWIAGGGIFALELGGVVFLSNADVRRRLGEQATASRLLGSSIAGAAATFNIVTHHNWLLGGFFALMSVLGFASWWLDVEAKRRDRLRVRGLLPPPPPRYALWGHWLRHPIITAQARNLARAHPQLGLYGSLQAALIVHRREQRNAALADALEIRIRHAVGRKMAHIAVLTYDMDEIARRLRANADYDGLTTLLGSELTAEHVVHGRHDNAIIAARSRLTHHPAPLLPVPGPPVADTVATANEQPAPPDAPADTRPSNRGRTARTNVTLPDEQPAPQAHGSGRWPQRLDTPHRSSSGAVNGNAAVLAASGTAPILAVRHDTTRAATVRPGGPADDGHPHPPDTPTPPRASMSGAPPTNAPGPPRRRTVHVTVLGQPAILDPVGQPARGVRAKSMELLVFLTVHRQGAALDDILEAVWPDVPPHRANQRLSTCLSNLRNIIRSIMEAAEHDDSCDDPPTVLGRPEPICNTGGHYHLDPAIVSADWWDLLDQHEADPAEATDDVMIAHAARIADGYDYPWLGKHRQHASAEEPASQPTHMTG